MLLIDADALITGFDTRLEDLVGTGAHEMIFTRDMNGINSGIALFHSSPRMMAFLEETYQALIFLNHPW